MYSKHGWSYSLPPGRRARVAAAWRRSAGSLARLAPIPAALLVTLALGYQAGTFAPPSVSEPAQGPVDAPLADLAPPGPQPATAGVATRPPAPSPSRLWRPTASPSASPAPSPLPEAILPGRRVLAYYGNPLAPSMGILGAPRSDEMLARLLRQAEAYAAADAARPVQTALELVTPSAQAAPGPEGLYRARMPPELIDRVATWAEASNSLLILDVQVGRSTVADEVAAILPYLKRPYVHLALDPEFAMANDHVPGKTIGSMDAETINRTIQTLSSLVVAEHLPPKVLIVHRFTEDMVTGSKSVQPVPEVQVVLTMDGFGSPALKSAQYGRYVRDQPIQFAGIKLFYDQDKPLMAPADVLELDPSPDLVIYQ